MVRNKYTYQCPYEDTENSYYNINNCILNTVRDLYKVY